MIREQLDDSVLCDALWFTYFAYLVSWVVFGVVSWAVTTLETTPIEFIALQVLLILILPSVRLFVVQRISIYCPQLI